MRLQPCSVRAPAKGEDHRLSPQWSDSRIQRHKALGTAGVFSKRQSPGQCPTYGCDFSSWALPSAVRCLGSALQVPGLHHQPASLGRGALVRANPRHPKSLSYLHQAGVSGFRGEESSQRNAYCYVASNRPSGWGLEPTPQGRAGAGCSAVEAALCPSWLQLQGWGICLGKKSPWRGQADLASSYPHPG